jgi:hypothetical protein
MGTGTRRWDAVDTAAAALDSADGRRTVLIVSDGEDTRSHLQRKDAIQRCQDRGISVHALGMWTQLLGATHAPSPELKGLTGDTGGAYFPLRPADDPAPIVSLAIDGMRHGYALEFSPAARDGKRHQIQVRVNRPGLTVRWRQTYLAPR